MQKRPLMTVALTAVLLGGLVGVASVVLADAGGSTGASSISEQTAHEHAVQAPAATTTDAASAYREAAMAMQHDMDMANSGDPDIDFATGMLAHHQGAVAMAKVELEYGKDPEMRALAEKIIAAQQAEIEQMQAWLKANAPE